MGRQGHPRLSLHGIRHRRGKTSFVELVHPGSSGNAAQILPLAQALGAFQRGPFSHAPDEQIGLGVHKDGLTQGVCPKIVMRNATQAGFNAAQNYRQTGKSPARQIGVNQTGAVGARTSFSARRVCVIMPLFAKGRVVSQQGIQRASADPDKKARPAHDQKVISVFPSRLRHNARSESVVDKPARKQHAAERGVIHVSIAVDQKDVQLIPAKFTHFLHAHGHKTGLGQNSGTFIGEKHSGVHSTALAAVGLRCCCGCSFLNLLRFKQQIRKTWVAAGFALLLTVFTHWRRRSFGGARRTIFARRWLRSFMW